MYRRKPQATRTSLTSTARNWNFKAIGPYAAGVLAVVFAIGIFASIPDNEATDSKNKEASLRLETLELNIPQTDHSADIEASISADFSVPVSLEVRSGDNMSLLFQRAGIGSTIVHQLAYESEHGEDFADIRPGKHFEFYFNADEKVERIDYIISPLERFIAHRSEDGFDTEHQLLTPDILPALAVGEIQSSFYMAGVDANLNDRLIMELANIFGWDIDFVFDIRQGDQFSVLYEERYLNGEKLGTGNILAAEFINRGRSYKAVRYEDVSGKTAYYTPDGESMRKAFLRTPLDVFRISSHFNLNRKHPVLNTIRAHKGTDYAASRGTPIKASGDGKVIYASVQGGYGNVIKIQHGQTYRTVYAHLDRFARGMSVGKRVEQGDIIGYVGSTGLATGPHLHYEFYVNGVVRNPITVQLPNGTPVPNSEMDRFKTLTQPALALLDGVTTNYVAQRQISPNPGS